MSITQHGNVFVADTARVTGEVDLGEHISLWYGAVIRGDVAKITIGPGTNVQDNAVIHCDSGVPNTIEDDVIIGHGAIVHGRHVGKGSLIGMGATVLGQSIIGNNCLIAAGAVVPPGLHVPDNHVVMGVPGKVIRPVRPEELEYMAHLVTHYITLAKRYVSGDFNRSAMRGA